MCVKGAQKLKNFTYDKKNGDVSHKICILVYSTGDTYKQFYQNQTLLVLRHGLINNSSENFKNRFQSFWMDFKQF